MIIIRYIDFDGWYFNICSIYLKDKLAAIEEKLEEKEKLLLASNNNDINAIKIELQSLRELHSELKSCCDKTPVVPFVEVEKHVNNILSGYFGSENDEAKTLSKEDLAKTIKNLFIAKTELEARIASINSTLQVNVQDGEKIDCNWREFLSLFTVLLTLCSQRPRRESYGWYYEPNKHVRVEQRRRERRGRR